jgi:hypothetical protein
MSHMGVATTLMARIVVLGVLLPLCARAANPAALERLRADHQRVLDGLNVKHADGSAIDLDDPRVPGLLKRGWALAGEWAAAYLATHPALSASDLKRIFDGFAPKPRGVKSKYGEFLEYPDYNFEGDAIRLGPAVFVVHARYFRWGGTDTFMVVARDGDGHFQALWNIKDLAEKHYALRDEIGLWAFLPRWSYYSGPLETNRLIALSTASNGHERFLVDAFQAADGGTALCQLSIWEWDGRGAKPLLIKPYQFARDFDRFTFDGSTIRIKTKEETANFFACGMCPEPEGTWSIRIAPDGVEDMGHRFRQPEIQWADELLSKALEGEDATRLAAADVVTSLQTRLEKGPKGNRFFSCGMLAGIRILRRGQSGAFEVSMDECSLRFRYVLRKGKPYFTGVAIK